MNKKNFAKITLIIFAILLVILLSVGVYYFYITKNAVNQITKSETPKINFSVYVLSSDKAEKIEDTLGYKYGICTNGTYSEEENTAISQIEKIFGEKPQIKEYENIFMLVNSLKEQQSNAIILNDAFKTTLEETEGYEWTKDGIKKIESFGIAYKGDEVSQLNSIPEELPETFNVYISGIDTYGDLSVRSRSDVNIVMAVNTKEGKIVNIATPRDYYVNFAAAGDKKDKLAHAGIYGIDMSIDAIERLYDIKIDYYLKINFDGFVKLIDALGGVEVYSKYDFSVKNVKDYHQGYNQLNGIEALAFARERYSFANGDYQRAENQMEVIKAVVNKINSSNILLNYAPLMDSLKDCFQTNMPQSQILSLIKGQIKEKKQWSVSSHTADGTGTYAECYSMPGRDLFVIFPSPASIKENRAIILGSHV